MSRMAMMAGVVVVVFVVAAVGYYMLADDEGGDELSATINGSAYTYAEMEDEFGTKTVDGIEGVPLDALVEDTGLANPETYQYILKAEDGYAMAVNWTNLQTGILTRQTDENEDTGEEEAYLRTMFPGLPSAYKVGKVGKSFTGIEPTTGLTRVVCNDLEYYLDYMPFKVGEKTIKHNDTFSPTGWSLSDIVNYTGLENPDSYDYTVVGYDASDEEPWFNTTVSWDDMLNGVLVEEDTRVWFDESTGHTSGNYRVKFVVEIIVE